MTLHGMLDSPRQTLAETEWLSEAQTECGAGSIMHLVYGSRVSGSLRCSCNLVGESVLSLQTSRNFGVFPETFQHSDKCCARGSSLQ